MCSVCIVGCLRGERIKGCFTPLTPSSVVWSVAILHKPYVESVSAIIRVLEPVRSVVVSETVLKPAIRGMSRRRLRFDRFAITVSAERVGWWIERRFHQRVPRCKPGYTQHPAPRPHTRVVNRLLTLDQSDRHPRRERSFRPFRHYGVDGASQLVDRATVPPPCTTL